MPDVSKEPFVEFIHSPVINFAMQQNHVPVVRKLLLINTAEKDLENVVIELISEPEFAVDWQHKIDKLAKNERLELNTINLKISAKYLSELTERVEGTFKINIRCNESVIYKGVFDVSVLAYDQWNGINILPEMLSAFITPNHPEIARVIKKASSILDRWTGNPSLDAYQTQNPDRVKKQMAAVFEAIAEMQITYCTVPASFEAAGQRIRLCDTIFSQKMANCLDLSLLYAACLEAIGLHPLVVIIKGHAFAGAWLIEDSFADSTNDDVSLITKRTAEGIDEIAVVETTSMNAGQEASFDEAVRAANRHLIKEEDFYVFLDVKRSRFGGIRPLPLRIMTPDGWEIIDTGNARNTGAPEEIVTQAKLVHVDKIEVSKQSLWERKLLDLSLRNNLLNLRQTKTTIQLITPGINKLEDALAGGTEFQILPKPSDWDNSIRNTGLYQSIRLSDPVNDLVKQEFLQNRLRSFLAEDELVTNITALYRAAKLSLEENGANTLFIALGLLKWFETGVSERSRYAPILLMPVEIVRKSAQKGYIIRSREEDTMMNITLLEMMRQDFGINIGGLNTLPKDDNGVDVKAVFSIIRQGILSQSRWEVEEQIFLGTFSFSKFIMWNDIHINADKLSRNKIVSSLMAGQLKWEVDGGEVNEDFDKIIHPSQIALPISTDSSQLEAISESVKDKSFILHGPPGTGKSQTITNIIANALYNGKKVLFVAEKMAALQVVQDRLEAIGLGPFCLELHSNKSKKSAVLEQLKRTSEISGKKSSEDFSTEAERLFVLRKELNGYVDALHKVYHFGFSLYDAFTNYAQLEIVTGTITFSKESTEQLTKLKLSLWNDLTEELQSAGTLIGHPFDHPLKEIQTDQYTQQLKNEAVELLKGYERALGTLQLAEQDVRKALKTGKEIQTEEDLNELKLIATLLLQLPDTPATLIGADNLEPILLQVIDLADHGRKRDALKAELTQNYTKEILSFPARQHLAEWNTATQQWFLPRWFKQNAIKKVVNKLSLAGKIDNNRIVPLFNTIKAYQQEQEYIDEKGTQFSSMLSFSLQGGNCDWEKLKVISNTLLQLNKQLVMFFGNITEAKKWRISLAQQCTEGSKMLVDVHENVLINYIDSYNKTVETETATKRLLNVDFLTIDNSGQDKITNSLKVVKRLLDNINDLKDWCHWNTTKQKAIEGGLFNLVSAFEAGEISTKEVINSFKKGFYRSCIDYIFRQEQQLTYFNGKLFDDKIRRFKEITLAFEKLTREELYAKLSSKIPSFTQEASHSSEISFLQRAIRTNGRGTSIRKLFDSIPNLLPRMHPCMLMSPISVAQYFDADTTKFDLVVFDEASQMPTCDAVGAIARGNNVVIVGDPKQMPPTNFFTTNHVDEENFDKEDLESILDDCLALSMPSRHLLWHYRSKHESLIAFSNSKFYENKLLTFPSPDDITSKVQFVHVEGFYDRGRTKQNKAEAQAIVQEIVDRLSHPLLCKRSIGVVTFSSVQQSLIEDLLAEKLSLRPDLEAAANQSAEPVFIKNLENVQGDERDVILFSVGYGPDKEGRMSLNFGPVNREGGWRRLNVAVSRARYEMKVFSTLKADKIDITRTASEGVAGLRSFLEYAEKGRSVLELKNETKKTETQAFVEIIAGEIRQNGYEVHTNIGASGYKIDIGVVDAENTSSYLLGILCDGQNYKAAKTARDREIVQVDVLRSLGWNIHKIWSVEWWEDKERQIKEVVAAIKRAEETKHVAVPEMKVPELVNIIPTENAVLNNSSAAVENPKRPVTNELGAEYRTAILWQLPQSSPDEFLLPKNRQKVCDQILQVVETEAPVSRNLLYKRVLAAWNITRLGPRLSSYIDSLISTLNLKTTNEMNTLFFWKQDQQPEDYARYRFPKTDTEKRDPDDLCAVEVANAVKQVVINQVSLSKDELIKETAKLFGFARIGTNVEQAMIEGFTEAIDRGFIAEQNERVVLKS